MKNLFLALAVLLTSVAGIAQNVEIINDTSNPMYVELQEVDAFCNSTMVTVIVPPNSSVIAKTTNPSSEFVFAMVAEDWAPINMSCFYSKQSVPWTGCSPWTMYAPQETKPSCLGPDITTTWLENGSAPGTPKLTIRY